MDDRHVLLLAVAAWAGALAGPRVPPSTASRPVLWALVGAVALALAARRPLLVCLAVAGLASVLSARAWAPLDEPPRPVGYRGVVVLVGDPQRAAGAWRARVRLADGRLAEAWARGRPADALAPRLAGERLLVRGRLRAPPDRARRHLAPLHVSAQLHVAGAEPAGDGPAWHRAANGLRRTVTAGAEPLGRERRSLLTGLVVGDDRDQPPELVADLSAAGLTHLTAVSGQNVAFALAVAGPVLRRLRLAGRFAAACAVLALFGTVTRWEPSVLRAVAMAGLAQAAVTYGVEAVAVRSLALATAGLVLADPLLVHRLGFRLSVAASAGLALLAGPLARRLRGPRPVREALATTLAAQAGVSPLLAAEGLPLAAVPANVAAAPAAGAVMMWGLTGGVLAGALGPPAATVLHLPTVALLAWITGAARVAAALPLGTVGLGAVVTAAAAAAAAAAARGRRSGLARLLAAAGLAAVVAPSVASATGAPPPLDGQEVAGGVRVWRCREGAVAVAVGRAGPARALSALHRHRVRRIDLLVVTDAGPGAGPAVAAVLRRHDVRALAGPARLDVAGLVAVSPGDRLVAGCVALVVSRRPGGGLDLATDRPP